MKKRLIALGMVLVLALAGCSDGGTDDGDVVDTTTATTAAP